MTPALSDRIRNASLNGRDGFTVDCFSRALLLVKAAGSRGNALEISSRPTQLLDVRATLQALARLEGPTGDGTFVLADSFPNERERSLIAGSFQPLKARTRGSSAFKKFIHLCQGVKRGQLDRYVHSSRSGSWAIRPDLDVSC